jgi:hypothetical protein
VDTGFFATRFVAIYWKKPWFRDSPLTGSGRQYGRKLNPIGKIRDLL